MNLDFIMDTVLVLLLASTLAYCVVLERRLRRLRQEQATFDKSLRAFSTAIGAAQASLSGLRNAAEDVGESLKRQIDGAHALADELSLLGAAGERIAKRIEAGARTPAGAAPAISADKLRAIR